MQKRNEATKREKVFFRTKLKHTAIVVLCIIFALSTISAVDITTNKLLPNDKDQFAMRIAMPSEDTMRLDVAGLRYDIDIHNVRTLAGNLGKKTKDMMTQLQNKLR